MYFYQNGEAFAWYVPYHPLIAVFFMFVSKVANYGWNFGDVFVIILCRIIVYQVKMFNGYVVASLKEAGYEHNKQSTDKIAKESSVFHVRRRNSKTGGGGGGPVDWTQIRLNFLLLCEIFKGITDYIAPIVMLCYACNIFFVVFNVKFK